MSNLKTLIKDYQDAYGLVSNEPVPAGQKESSLNGLLYTSEYMVTLLQRGECESHDFEIFNRIVEHCSICPGYYIRHPLSTDVSSFDDYVGISAASSKFAQNILDYSGERKGIDGHQVRLWLQRQVIAHLLFAAGRKPNFFDRFIWCISIISSMFAAKTNQDAHMLSWLLVYRMAKGYKTTHKAHLCALVGLVWLKVYRARFKQEAQAVCARTLRPGHPLGTHFIHGIKLYDG